MFHLLVLLLYRWASPLLPLPESGCRLSVGRGRARWGLRPRHHSGDGCGDGSVDAERAADWLLPAPACQQASHRYAHCLTGEGDLQQAIPDILLGKGDIPRLVIIGVSVTGALLVLLNVGLVTCFIYRKRNKRLREGTVGSVLGESMSRCHNELAFGLFWAFILLKVWNKFCRTYK